MSLTLGTTKRGKLRLTDEERSWHVQVLGGSGRGKSSLLESMIRQDILALRGLCLIDPHGTLADDILAWCASRRVNEVRKIHVIDAADLEWSASFNPLRHDGVSDPSVRVDAMVAACAQVWGGEDPNRTPLLRKCLTAVFYALTVHGLTLVEATELINSSDPYYVRRKLTENLPDHVFQGLWQDFNHLRPSTFLEQFSSTSSRLNLFLKSPGVRRMLGQTSRCIDLKEIMDRGEILIVNLASKNRLSPENVRLLGTLLTSELFLLAVARDREIAKRRPFTLYIDECADFVTDDVERMLDQTRKFGLHVVLSHQRLSQLRRRSDAIHDAVLGGAHTKIVFGGLMDDDAEVMAKEVYRGSFQLERAKESLKRLTVVDEVPYWLESESESYSSSTTHTAGSTSSYANSYGGSDTSSESYNVDGESTGTGSSSTTSFSSSSSESFHDSTGVTQGHSSTHGRSQTLKPVRVLLPTAVHSLEEELHLAIRRLRELPKQAAVVKRPKGYPVRIRPLEIASPITSKALEERFAETLRQVSTFTVPAEVAESEMVHRLADLRRQEAPQGDDEFFSEEPV